MGDAEGGGKVPRREVERAGAELVPGMDVVQPHNEEGRVDRGERLPIHRRRGELVPAREHRLAVRLGAGHRHVGVQAVVVVDVVMMKRLVKIPVVIVKRAILIVQVLV